MLNLIFGQKKVTEYTGNDKVVRCNEYTCHRGTVNRK